MTTVHINKIQIPGLVPTIIPESDWEELDSCLLCGKESTLLMEVEGGAALSICVDCRYGFLSRRPTAQWFERFYASEWDQVGQANGTPPLVPNPRAYTAVKDILPEYSRVLDVGAGFGGMLFPFLEAGHYTFAVEPSDHRRQFLRNHHIKTRGSLEDIGNGALGTFDLIISHHSLEHLHSPAYSLRRMVHLLKDDGLLYLAMPSMFQEHAIQAAHFVPHLSLFNFETLVKHLGNLGMGFIAGQHGMDLEVVAKKGKAFDVSLGFPDSEKFISTAKQWAKGDFIQGQQTHLWSLYGDKTARYPRQIGNGHINFDEPRLRAVWTDTEDLDGTPVTFNHKDSKNAVWVK